MQTEKRQGDALLLRDKAEQQGSVVSNRKSFYFENE